MQSKPAASDELVSPALNSSSNLCSQVEAMRECAAWRNAVPLPYYAMQTFFNQVKKPPSPTLRRGRRSASQHNLFRYANVLGLREEV